jgi:hypothetical protein
MELQSISEAFSASIIRVSFPDHFCKKKKQKYEQLTIYFVETIHKLLHFDKQSFVQ